MSQRGIWIIFSKVNFLVGLFTSYMEWNEREILSNIFSKACETAKSENYDDSVITRLPNGAFLVYNIDVCEYSTGRLEGVSRVIRHANKNENAMKVFGHLVCLCQ